MFIALNLVNRQTSFLVALGVQAVMLRYLHITASRRAGTSRPALGHCAGATPL